MIFLTSSFIIINKSQVMKSLRTNKIGLRKLIRFKTTTEKSNDEPPIPLPVTCCGSGCQNCVWIEYAENIQIFYKNKYSDSKAGLLKALEEIEKLEDENIKSFLKMEINSKLKN